MTDTLDHTRETLWVTDAELIRRSGIPRDIARRFLRECDRIPSGFPLKDPMMGDRRYWPAVKSYFERRTEARMTPSLQRRRA